MKTEILFDGECRVFLPPPGTDLIGITVVRGGMDFSVFRFGGFGRDEEIPLPDGGKFIFHCYSAPEIAEVMREFAPFGGMVFTEIESGKLRVRQTV